MVWIIYHYRKHQAYLSLVFNMFWAVVENSEVFEFLLEVVKMLLPLPFRCRLLILHWALYYVLTDKQWGTAFYRSLFKPVSNVSFVLVNLNAHIKGWEKQALVGLRKHLCSKSQITIFSGTVQILLKIWGLEMGQGLSVILTMCYLRRGPYLLGIFSSFRRRFLGYIQSAIRGKITAHKISIKVSVTWPSYGGLKSQSESQKSAPSFTEISTEMKIVWMKYLNRTADDLLIFSMFILEKRNVNGWNKNETMM